MALQFQILFSQFKQYKENFEKENSLIFVERCPWTAKNVFAPLFFSDESCYTCFEKIYDTLSYDVDYFIYLKVPAEIAFERILERNREGESESITLDYLRILEQRFEDKMNELRSKVFTIDGTKSEDKVLRQVISILKGEIVQNLISK